MIDIINILPIIFMIKLIGKYLTKMDKSLKNQYWNVAVMSYLESDDYHHQIEVTPSEYLVTFRLL